MSSASSSSPAPDVDVVPPLVDVRIPHHPLEDVFGMLTGTFLAALGLFLLETVGAVTGGTAGPALLLTYVSALPFGVLYLLVNVPFFLLAIWQKGWMFTVRSAISVAAVSGFSVVIGRAVDLDHVDAAFGVLVGNLLVGVGLLILFRHGSSMGGFGILALVLQDRAGIRAGYVQMVLDLGVILLGLMVMPWTWVLLSALGGALLNVVLAVNHRPGRYLA